jgi:hypothetical protein
MRRRGLLSNLRPTLLLGLFFVASNNGIAQSAIQAPSCSGVVQGIVSNRSGQPVKGIKVVAWPLGVDLGTLLPTTETDVAGEYRFKNLCRGRYTVLPDDEGMGYPSASPYLFGFLYGRRVTEVKLDSQNSLAIIPIRLPPQPSRMHVRVIDAATNAEILEFAIEVKVPGQRFSPKIKYFFNPDMQDREIEVPPNTDFILKVTAHGFREWSGDSRAGKVVRVPSGTEASFDAQLQPVK